MSNTQSSPSGEDEALAPEAAAVISRARRSFGFSIGLLLLGFVAIAGALVYRAGAGGGNPGRAYEAAAISLPAGAEVVSALPSEGLIAVTYRLGGRTILRLHDGKTGELIRDIAIGTE